MKKLYLILSMLILFTSLGLAQSVAIVSNQGNMTTASATCTTTNCVSLRLQDNAGSSVIRISGTAVGTVNFEASPRGTNWYAITGYPLPTGAGASTATAAGVWQFSASGMKWIRVRRSVATSGTFRAEINGSIAAFTPPSASTITGGDASAANQVLATAELSDINTNTTGISTSAKQDSLIASNAAIETAVEIIDDPVFTIGAVRADRVGIFNSAGTQIDTFGGGTQYADGDASGTETGTLSMWSDGTNTWAASTAHRFPVVATQSGTWTVTGAGGTFPVTGTFWQATQPVSGTFWQATQPVSGTVTANLSDTDNTILDDIAASLATVVDGTKISGFNSSPQTGTTSTQVIAATASNYLYLTHCSFSNNDPDTDTMVYLQDGDGGATIWPVLVPFGSGREVPFNGFKTSGTAGHALYMVPVTTGASITVACHGFTSTVSY